MSVRVIATLLLLLASGCGSKGALIAAEGRIVPPTPVATNSPPTPDEMLTLPPQGAPERADDPVRRPTERGDDRFDLPPTF